MTGVEVDWSALREAANAALEHAYVPYSKFPVGVAAIVDDGRVISGANGTSGMPRTRDWVAR